MGGKNTPCCEFACSSGRVRDLPDKGEKKLEAARLWNSGQTGFGREFFFCKTEWNKEINVCWGKGLKREELVDFCLIDYKCTVINGENDNSLSITKLLWHQCEWLVWLRQFVPLHVRMWNGLAWVSMLVGEPGGWRLWSSWCYCCREVLCSGQSILEPPWFVVN